MRPERGFVLPTSLMVMTLLTVMLMAAFILVSAEFRSTDNSMAGARSLALAEAGLQDYFTRNRGLDTASTSDSVKIVYGSDSVQVVASRVRAATPSTLALWVVRATGFAGRRSAAGQPQARRALAQFAEFRPGVLPARAAMVAANGVSSVGNGNSPISGRDATFCSPRNDTFGLTVASGDYPGNAPLPNGSPSGLEPGFAGGSEVVDSTRIDWSRLLAGDFTPDYVAAEPCRHPAQTAGGFPVGFCDGDAVLTGRRYGLLVVTGSVTLGSGVHWDGIIVAGDDVDAGGNFGFTVHGMIISGLNTSLGRHVIANRVRLGGGRVIQWASCYNGPSVATLAGLVPIRNAWVDNWSTY